MKTRRQVIHQLAERYEWATVDPTGDPDSLAPNIHCWECRAFVVVEHDRREMEDLLEAHHEKAHAGDD